MPDEEIKKVIERSRETGWVLEPDAKRVMALSGMDVPQGLFTADPDEACRFARKIGYPVVAKVVSPRIVHKSEAGGVVTGIRDDKTLAAAFERFRGLDGYMGVLVEESVSGLELIVGGKVDEQFGPVVLVGMGGVGVEIYRDTVIRMAPLEAKDVEGMLGGLTASRVLDGYRGGRPVNRNALVGTVVKFSCLLMEIEGDMESADLNPVMCTPERCVVADARIMLV